MGKPVLLDTSFILNAIRDKIDLFEEISSLGLFPIIPEGVLGELSAIASAGKKLKFREEAKLALALLDKAEFDKIRLDSKVVDAGIVNFSKSHPEAIIATMDKALKNKIYGQKLVIRAGEKLEIV